MENEREGVIADLLETGFGLLICCSLPSCYREVRWGPQEAVQRLGRLTTLPQAQRRLSCTRCGSKGRHGFITCRVDPEDRDEAALRWRYENAKMLGKPVDLAAGLEIIERRRANRLAKS